MDGFINVFKPKGLTSHDVVKQVKKILHAKKVGHTGTLDPNACGVLPICIGKGTRASEYLVGSRKKYVAELTLGYETDTQDEEGSVLNYSDKKVTEKEIVNALNYFKGEIYQVPPMYSALKHQGRKLYELAREGIEVERKKRKVNIYNIEILNIIDNKKIIFSVECSKGTYIRTLCNDIGEYLGTYGYMSYLIRESVGQFKLEDAVSIETIYKKCESFNINDILIPIDQALSSFDSIIVKESFYKKISNGMSISLNELGIHIDIDLSKKLRVYCGDIFIGIGEVVNKNNTLFLKIDKVLL